MSATLTQQVVLVAVLAVATALTRFLPFWLFPAGKPIPRVISYLGKTLPGAVMGLLVIYCLKDVQWTAPSHGAPELLAVIAVVLLHWYKRNTLLSIGGGTVLYMVQWIFT